MQLTMPSRKSPEGKGERKQYGSSLLTLGCRFPKVSFLWILFCTKSPTICGASLVAQRLNIHLQCRRPGFDPWVGNIPWRRKWQPTPVFLPGESQGQRSLVGYIPWGCKESATTKKLHFHFLFHHIPWYFLLCRRIYQLSYPNTLE